MANIDIGTFGIWTSLLDAHPTSKVREIVAQLDEQGWGALWRPESTGRDALISSTIWLESCERMAIATGIAQTYARHPLTAMAASKTIDEAFPSRFLLGLGVGHAPMINGVRGLEYKTPLADMSVYLDAMDAAPYAALELDERPPRILAALGPKMLALSAAKADGAHPYFAPPAHTALAREVARENMHRYLQLPNYTNNLKRLGFSDDDISGPSDKLVDAIVLWGDLDSIVARIREHVDAGADHVCVQALVSDQTTLPLDDWSQLAEALL